MSNDNMPSADYDIYKEVIPYTYNLSVIPQSSDDFFEITHGITMWTHNTLGFTIARDNTYFGKPIRLPCVIVSNEFNDTPDVGMFWLDTTYSPAILKTYRNDAWIDAVDIAKGTVLFDQKNNRILVKVDDAWHALQSTPL